MGLYRGLSLNFGHLRRANHKDVTVEYMCTEKNILENVYKWTKNSFATTCISRKAPDYLIKENFRLKEIMLVVFWNMKRHITINFLEKVQNQTVFSVANSLDEIHFSYWITHVSIYLSRNISKSVLIFKELYIFQLGSSGDVLYFYFEMKHKKTSHLQSCCR